MPRILIADSLAPAGVELLRESAEVDELRDEDRPRLASLIANYDAVIVRSGTQITREVLEGGDRLKVVGRAGVGVDNIDIAGRYAARRAGDQRADRQLAFGHRAHIRPAAGAGAADSVGRRVAQGEALGPQEPRGQRAAGEGARRDRLRSDRSAGGHPGPGLRDGSARLRPLPAGGGCTATRCRAGGSA